MQDPLFIDGKTQKYGIIGYPLTHTKSPQMHNAFLMSKILMPSIFLLK